jgi:thiamine-monophosphate kinase
VVRDVANASMDVSDGLAGDLTKLCAASDVSAVIDTSRIPLSAPAVVLLSRRVVEMETLISGGDDYEILLTVGEAQVAALAEAAAQAGVAIVSIGKITAENGPPRFLDAQGNALALKRLSYSHF